MMTATLQPFLLGVWMIGVGYSFPLLPHRRSSPQTTCCSRKNCLLSSNSLSRRSLRIRRRHRKTIGLLASSDGKDDEFSTGGSEDVADAQQEVAKSVDETMSHDAPIWSTPMDLLAPAVSKPMAFVQKAMDIYWEESDKDVFETSSKQQAKAARDSIPSLPSVVTMLQLLQLLSEIYNDPNVDGQLTVLEAWRESKMYGNETRSRGSSNPMADSAHESNVTAIRKNFDAINRSKWMASWNDGLTNEDVRDLGDHIWRYLIGDWSKVRRNKVLLSLVRAACIAVLTWGFIESLLTSLAASSVWTWTAMTKLPHTQSIPWLPVAQHREALFQSYSAFRLRLDPVFFASKALGTLVLVPYYENLVCTVERVCFKDAYRKRYPLISRLQGLLLSFAIGFAAARLLTVGGFLAGSLLTLFRNWVITLATR